MSITSTITFPELRDTLTNIEHRHNSPGPECRSVNDLDWFELDDLRDVSLIGIVDTYLDTYIFPVEINSTWRIYLDEQLVYTHTFDDAPRTIRHDIHISSNSNY